MTPRQEAGYVVLMAAFVSFAMAAYSCLNGCTPAERAEGAAVIAASPPVVDGACLLIDTLDPALTVECTTVEAADAMAASLARRSIAAHVSLRADAGP